MKPGFRQWPLSVAIFGLMIFALVSVDERVQEQFDNLVWGADGLANLHIRLAEMGSAVMSALRFQSIENAPFLLFAVVGAVLFLFMVRS